MTSRRRGVKAGLVIVGTIVSIALSEVLLRLTGIGYGNAPSNSHRILHHVHPKNYSFVSYDPNSEYGGHRVAFDGDGYRVDPSRIIGGDSCRTANRVAFMGDSFVEALSVPFAESFVGRLSKFSNGKSEIRNFGVSSYSPILYNLQWEKDVRAFKPTHVFLLLYSNDIHDDVEYHRIAELDSRGSEVAVPGPSQHWIFRAYRRLYLARLLRRFYVQVKWSLANFDEIGGLDRKNSLLGESPDITQLTARRLLTLRAAVEETGAKFFLMAVPSKRQLTGERSGGEDDFSDKVKRWSAEFGVNFVDLTPAFGQGAARQGLFHKIDIHFNSKGHGVVAGVLAEEFPDLFSCAESKS